MSDPITILIVDDHAVVRRGVRAFLEAQQDFAVVGEAGSGGEAVLLAADLAPDVVLMDLVMPGMDGVQATRLVKQKSPCSQVIVLTSYHEDEHIFPAIRAGALSYLLKDIGLPDLADAIRKAARGEVVMHPHIAARVVQELDGASHHGMGRGAEQRRDRRAARPQRKDGEKPRPQHPRQAASHRPHAGRHLCLAPGVDGKLNGKQAHHRRKQSHTIVH